MAVRTLTFGQYSSPIGEINYAVLDGALAWLGFADKLDRETRLLNSYYPGHDRKSARNPLDLDDRLKAYFSRDFGAFKGVRLAEVGTDFQRRVWAALCKVRPGKAATYSDLAAQVSKSKGMQAVGQANSRNPFSLIVPCHRVVGKDGSIRGYAGGTHRQYWLLGHEGAVLKG